MKSYSATLAVSLLIVVTGCGESDTTRTGGFADPVGVIVEPLQFERAATRLEAVGTSRALQSADLYPVASGEVVAVNFEPGERVGKGEVLVELDSREELLAVRLAEVRLKDAERLLDRYRRSSDSGAVTQTVLDQAETAVEAGRIELDQARVALEDRQMVAPFDGYVGVTEVDVGDRIGPSTLVTTLDDRSEILVSFAVPEAFVGQLSAGDRVNIQTWSARSPDESGDIVDISSRIDPQTRTFVVRARVVNDDDDLRPGMSFRVVADLDGERFPVVTETALQWGADGAYVWSVVDDTANRIPVDVVQRREGRVLIEGDLKLGDIIVVEGIQQMRDGVQVQYEPRSITGTTDAPTTDGKALSD